MTTAEAAMRIFEARIQARGVMDIGMSWSIESMDIAWDLAEMFKRKEREYLIARGDKDA